MPTNIFCFTQRWHHKLEQFIHSSSRSVWNALVQRFWISIRRKKQYGSGPRILNEMFQVSHVARLKNSVVIQPHNRRATPIVLTENGRRSASLYFDENVRLVEVHSFLDRWVIFDRQHIANAKL